MVITTKNIIFFVLPQMYLRLFKSKNYELLDLSYYHLLYVLSIQFLEIGIT